MQSSMIVDVKTKFLGEAWWSNNQGRTWHFEGWRQLGGHLIVGAMRRANLGSMTAFVSVLPSSQRNLSRSSFPLHQRSVL